MLMRTRNEKITSDTNDYRFDDKPEKYEREYTYSCRCPDSSCDQKRSTAWRKTKNQIEEHLSNTTTNT